MKDGTIASDSNLIPWRDYRPLVPWLMGLWVDHKLSDEKFMALSSQFRSGHANRRRDLLDVVRDKKHALVSEHVAQELAELERSGSKKDFKVFEVVEEFVELFRHAAWRRPMLLIVGGSGFGKSMLAAHIMTKVGELVQAPGFLEITVEDDEVLDLAGLDLTSHAGVVFDGVGDVLTLKNHRETLQGRPKVCSGGKSSTMMYSYPFTLSRRAVVITMDLSAKRLPLLKTDHWLSNSKNCMVLHLTEPSWIGGSIVGSVTPVSPRDVLEQLSVAELSRFLEERDLSGPAAHLATQGVNGKDFLNLTKEEFIQDVRVTPFVANKSMSVRESFLRSA